MALVSELATVEPLAQWLVRTMDEELDCALPFLLAPWTGGPSAIVSVLMLALC